MNLPNRIELLDRLRTWMLEPSGNWLAAKERASAANKWFLPAFVDRAVNAIATQFLDMQKLQDWCAGYQPMPVEKPVEVGIVMAGNIPMAGFHDWLCTFVSGHRSTIKLSAKDDALLPALLAQMQAWAPELEQENRFTDRLSGCDAYIATGSGNSANLFEYYFGRYPAIVRRNRTSVALLTGRENEEQLAGLADDIQLYFGLGCRNVTRIFVPEGYDFVPLLQALRRFNFFMDHGPYRNNFDYHLAIQIMNNRFYMTNDSIVLTEHDSNFSPIGQLNYSFYVDRETLIRNLAADLEIQCISGLDVPFGQTQVPGLADYADGTDTLQFLSGLRPLKY